MGVFFGFGDVQLAFTRPRHHIGQGVLQALGREGHRHVQVLVILGHAYVIAQLGPLMHVEAVKVGLVEGPGQLPGAVGPEVEEDDRVVVFDAPPPPPPPPTGWPSSFMRTVGLMNSSYSLLE